MNDRQPQPVLRVGRCPPTPGLNSIVEEQQPTPREKVKKKWLLQPDGCRRTGNAITTMRAMKDVVQTFVSTSVCASIAPDVVVAALLQVSSIFLPTHPLLGAAAFRTTSVVDAVVSMSACATTPDAVRWLSEAICHLYTNSDTLVR